MHFYALIQAENFASLSEIDTFSPSSGLFNLLKHLPINILFFN